MTPDRVPTRWIEAAATAMECGTAAAMTDHTQKPRSPAARIIAIATEALRQIIAEQSRKQAFSTGQEIGVVRWPVSCDSLVVLASQSAQLHGTASSAGFVRPKPSVLSIPVMRTQKVRIDQMQTKLIALAAATAMTGLLGASIALAQPTITNPSGGTGNSEMDHSRMGGSQGRTTPGPAPVLTNPSGGSGNSEMDHSRMGGGTPGVGTPGGSTMGNPTGDGPEVRHDNQSRPGNQPNPAPRPRN